MRYTTVRSTPLRRRRSLSVFAAALAAVLLVAAQPAAGIAGYGDVAADRYYAESVQWSADNDITGITGTCFNPDAPATRGETAVWIWNMEGRPEAPEHSFTDITIDDQHQPVAWMAETGITTGTSPTTFSPDDTLTRGQLAAFLWRLADRPEAPAHTFGDVTASWQQGPVSWMAQTGITTGTSDTTFSPEATLTRAHLATFLYRYRDEPAVTVAPDSPACAPSADSFKAVSAGQFHSCGIRADDTVECWGGNFFSQAAPPAGSFEAVSAGASYSCAIRTDGTIACWGLVGFHSLDQAEGNEDGSYTSRFVAADPPTGTFKSVSVGSNHSCAIRTDDTVACWGKNTIDDWSGGSPVEVSGGQTDPLAGTFKSVSVGNEHSCGLRIDNVVACWGGENSRYVYVANVAPPGTHKAVDTTGQSGCTIRTDDTVACWGDNQWGQLHSPIGTFKSVSVGSNHSCAIRTDDTVACWGKNTIDDWSGGSPVEVPTGQADPSAGTFKSVSVGNDHSCGLRTDNTVACWGDNRFGQTNVPQ